MVYDHAQQFSKMTARISPGRSRRPTGIAARFSGAHIGAPLRGPLLLQADGLCKLAGILARLNVVCGSEGHSFWNTGCDLLALRGKLRYCTRIRFLLPLHRMLHRQCLSRRRSPGRSNVVKINHAIAILLDGIHTISRREVSRCRGQHIIASCILHPRHSFSDRYRSRSAKSRKLQSKLTPRRRACTRSPSLARTLPSERKAKTKALTTAKPATVHKDQSGNRADGWTHPGSSPAQSSE
jgi:hypothetical protein